MMDDRRGNSRVHFPPVPGTSRQSPPSTYCGREAPVRLMRGTASANRRLFRDARLCCCVLQGLNRLARLAYLGAGFS